MSNYEISKSSLLSLKAEILRKQEDLSKAKLENAEKIKSIKKKTPLELKNKGVENRGLKDLDQEDQDLLKLSKSKLEAKSRLYEKLSYSLNQNEELNKRYLVQFDKKDKPLGPLPMDKEDLLDLPVESEDEEHYFSDEYDEVVDPSEEWVEYTDCLGRTRKCLRKDLEYMKSKEANLIAAKTPAEPERVEKVNNDEKATNDEKEKTTEHDIQSHVSSEDSELLSGDMKREMLRQQWEKEEEELREKTNIYYQNVLFDEARQHGVGYYAFSKDEEERIKQQEALKKLREETEQKQKKAQDLKAMREKQMAARIKAARNRRRARLGLPPEEDEPIPCPSESTEDLEEQKQKQEEQKKAEEAEKLLLEARQRHVRPWDIGKEGIGEHYEMTQNEWNEKQRQNRTKEFAPPQSYSSRAFSSMQSLEPDFVENNKSLKFSSKKNKEYKPNKQKSKSINPYKNNHDNIGKAATEYKDDSNDNLLETYKLIQGSAIATKGPNLNKNRSYEPSEPTSDDDNDNLFKDYKSSSTSVPVMEPVPIINELEETNFDDRLLSDYNKFMQKTLSSEENPNREANSLRKRGVEIAPPPIFEYYGPGESKRTKTSTEKVNISESIEAGLKFLRKQADRKGRHCVDETKI